MSEIKGLTRVTTTAMRNMARRARELLLALLVTTVDLASAQTRGDESFRITYGVDRGGAQIKVSGRVVNDSRFDALNVYVTAESLDANGRLVASGVSYVDIGIPPHGSAPFVATLPASERATTFRVRVTSFVRGPGLQAP